MATSPDGVLTATGDRAGGLFVWETHTGREFHRLEAQRGAITALAWRADGGAFAGKPWNKQHANMTDARPIKMYRPEGR